MSPPVLSKSSLATLMVPSSTKSPPAVTSSLPLAVTSPSAMPFWSLSVTSLAPATLTVPPKSMSALSSVIEPLANKSVWPETRKVLSSVWRMSPPVLSKSSLATLMKPSSARSPPAVASSLPLAVTSPKVRPLVSTSVMSLPEAFTVPPKSLAAPSSVMLACVTTPLTTSLALSVVVPSTKMVVPPACVMLPSVLLALRLPLASMLPNVKPPTPSTKVMSSPVALTVPVKSLPAASSVMSSLAVRSVGPAVTVSTPPVCEMLPDTASRARLAT